MMNKMPVFVTKKLKNVITCASLLSFALISATATASGVEKSICDNVLSGTHLNVFSDKYLMNSAKSILSKLRLLESDLNPEDLGSDLDTEDTSDVKYYITELTNLVQAANTYQEAYAIPYALILRNISGLVGKVNGIYKKNKLSLLDPGTWGAISEARRIAKTIDEIMNDPRAEIYNEARQLYNAVVDVRQFDGNVDTQTFESFIEDLVRDISKDKRSGSLSTVSENVSLFNPTNGYWVSATSQNLSSLSFVLKLPTRKIDKFGVVSLLHYSNLLSKTENTYVQNLIKDAAALYKSRGGKDEVRKPL